ncbi:hypothetical protein ZTR_01859 [Talaromyces verruculosus]|nr:hypothetical protein ZTR_01859 [Talaromyces verruculosus]
MPPNVYLGHAPDTRMPLQPDPCLNPHFDPLVPGPGIQTGLETSVENTHLGPVESGQGEIVPVRPFHVTAHVRTIYGLGGGIEPVWEHVPVPGERSDGYGFSHRQGNDADQTSRPQVYEWVSENPAETSKESDKKRDASMQRLTTLAGGSCIWCYKTKKRCDPMEPCNRCSPKDPPLPCVRGGYSSLCMAPTIDRYELHPDSFKKAEDTLDNLKKDLDLFNWEISVCWISHDGQYHETLALTADQLELRQADATLEEKWVDLALRFTPILTHCPNLSDDLHNIPNDAYRMFHLLAATKKLLGSSCFIGSVPVSTARAIVFYLVAIYIKELCKVSRRLAEKLYRVLNSKSATESKGYAIPVYLQIINGIIKGLNREWRGSLMLDIFAHMHPQLESVQKILHRLVLDERFESPSNAYDSFDSNLCQFDVMIGLSHEMPERRVPIGLQQMYTVEELLRSDFDESVGNLTTDPETIDPSVISFDMTWNHTIAYDASTTLYNSDNRAIFSYDARTQNTEITYPSSDAQDLTPSRRESTTDLGIAPGPEDFQYVGNHFEWIYLSIAERRVFGNTLEGI